MNRFNKSQYDVCSKIAQRLLNLLRLASPPMATYHGDTVTDVLSYVQYHAGDLLTTFRRKVNAALGLSRSEANRFIADYLSGLEGSTYLEGGEG